MSFSALPRLFAAAPLLAVVFALAPPAKAGLRSPPLYGTELPGGRHATVFRNGLVKIVGKDGRVTMRRFGTAPQGGPAPHGTWSQIPDKQHLARVLDRAPAKAFAERSVIVVYRSGITAQRDVFELDRTTLQTLRTRAAMIGPLARLPLPAPEYTTDAATNHVLAQLGADRQERLFPHIDRARLASLHASAQAKLGRPLLDFSNAYRLHITNASVHDTVARLAAAPGVAYASPEWTVATMNIGANAIPAPLLAGARLHATRSSAAGPHADERDIPANYALTSSLQSLLNAPGVDAAGAFDELATTFGQLPGEGETITNVSLGDLDDAGAGMNPSDRCSGWVQLYGPTTEIIGGQRYIDWPSMPLISTYTADQSGQLDGMGEVCGVDPGLGEIGLDFSVMAPLPHDRQRAANPGSGFTDLLGIAPGARYRLVVPASFSPTTADIDGALLGAALQSPRTDVITASLGFGFDYLGVSGRYLEDDPLTQAVVEAIVNQFDIVVCLSAGDGIRSGDAGLSERTNVAIGPSGGSAQTDVAAPGAPVTSLADIAFTGVPSVDYDSGAIDVGAVTLDDVFAAPPQYDFASGYLQAQHAFPETRFTGPANYASGFGSRVNVSAPGDNIVAFSHDGFAKTVAVNLVGGTSASAPEAAAAAAVARQTARLAGHSLHAWDVRSLLEQTGTTVPSSVPEAGIPLHVGPQIDVRRLVENLLAAGGRRGNPAVHRVAIEQRRDIGGFDDVFLTNTDPADITFRSDENYAPDYFLNAWITLAPDWQWLPAGTQYRLSIAGRAGSTFATTPWARVLPATILAKAGLPLAAAAPRTVTLRYDAQRGASVVASATFALTFGASSGKYDRALAPRAPATVREATFPFSYDLSNLRQASMITNLKLVISVPGQFAVFESPFYQQLEAIPLHGVKGTLTIPSPKNGDGIYGLTLVADRNALSPVGLSDTTFVRVAEEPEADVKPAAPLVARPGGSRGHSLEFPYGTPYEVSYDVRNVPGATGVALEISAPGPTLLGNFSPFNNPNGTERDANIGDYFSKYKDTGSTYFKRLSGTTGTVRLTPAESGLVPTYLQDVRVIPLRGDLPAGEGSDASVLQEDGVVPADGGYLLYGYDVNESGQDGLLTSIQQDASGNVLSTLETFAPATAQVDTSQTAPGRTSEFYTVDQAAALASDIPGGYGIFGEDFGLYGLSTGPFFGPFSYAVTPAVAAGAATKPWTIPDPSVTLWNIARNPHTSTIAVLGTTSNNSWRFFTSDLAKGTFSAIDDISADVKAPPNLFFGPIAEDTSSGDAYAGGYAPGNGSTQIPYLVRMDAKTLKARSVALSGTTLQYINDIAIDSHTHKAVLSGALGKYCTIYDLAGGAIREIAEPQDWSDIDLEPEWVAVDELHGRFFAGFVTEPDYLVNTNAMSHVLEFDENGTLLSDRGQFNFNAWPNAVSVSTFAHRAALVPTKKLGFLFTWNMTQLQPFKY